MNPEQKAYAKKIEDLRVYLRNVQQTFDKLIKECNHLIVSFGTYKSAVCEICGTGYGWYCEVSPTKYCQYDYQRNGEMCIFCRQPETRK